VIRVICEARDEWGLVRCSCGNYFTDMESWQRHAEGMREEVRKGAIDRQIEGQLYLGPGMRYKRLFAVTGWKYKWIFEVKRGAFRSFHFQVRRELRRWL